MRLHASSLLLLAGLNAPANGDAPEPTSGAPVAPAANPEAAPPPATAPPAAEAPQAQAQAAKPTVFDTAKALLLGSKTSAASIAQLRAQVTERDTTITTLQADIAARDATIATQLAELTQFREQTAALQATITTLETSAVSVEQEVNHRIAAANMPAAELPQAAAAPVATESAEELWKAAEVESDPKKKGDLAARAMALNTPKKPHGQN